MSSRIPDLSGRLRSRPQTLKNPLLSAIFTLLIIGFLLLVAFEDQLNLGIPLLATLRQNFYNDFIMDNRWTWLLSGLGQTLIITVIALMLGLVIGLGLALVKILEHNGKRIFFLTRFTNLYLTVIRGTPVVIQLLIIYFVVFGSVNVSKVIVAAMAFGINSGAYVAEIIRAGILAVDRGQMEAGRSLGLTYNVTMNKIVLPQAIKNVLPALGNEMITLLKETAVAGYIAVADLARAGDQIRARTMDSFLPFLVVALTYLLIVLGLTQLLGRLERRLRRSDNR